MLKEREKNKGRKGSINRNGFVGGGDFLMVGGGYPESAAIDMLHSLPSITHGSSLSASSASGWRRTGQWHFLVLGER